MAAWGAAVGGLATAVLVLTVGAATGAEAQPTIQAQGIPHIRLMDTTARRVFDDAAAASPTFARLVAALDVSDVVVLVSTSFMRDGLAGDTRLLAVTAGSRLLAIRIDKLRSEGEQMAWLAHELQHALEIAAVPDVRSDADVAALMMRIGRTGGTRGTFETDAAVRVGRQVQREIASAK
jgi:hypothetical protein